MAYKKILTIQDISCVGQCSLTVALPIISACGVETCVLPSAVLSTHTSGFSGFTVRDISGDMPAIREHWLKEGIRFSAIYTGYLGTAQQVDYVIDIFNTTGTPDCVKIVDPAMADHGVLYSTFDMDYVEAMKPLCAQADYLIPNITEACFLTGVEYKTRYDRAYIDEILAKLSALGCKNVILTGVSYDEETTGVAVLENGEYHYYCHEKLPNSCHGTGDIYASVFTGALMRGKTAFQAAKIAADFAVICIRDTANYPDHPYGAAFEPSIPRLIAALNE